jgi:hypothetical protein
VLFEITDSVMDNNALVVPDNAESTTTFGWPSSVMSWRIDFILSGFPTEVPPNFQTCIT